MEHVGNDVIYLFHCRPVLVERVTQPNDEAHIPLCCSGTISSLCEQISEKSLGFNTLEQIHKANNLRDLITS